MRAKSSRKETVTTLFQGKELLSKKIEALDASTDGIAILNENFEMVYVNNAKASIYGYKNAGDLTGKNWRILYSDAEANRLELLFIPSLKNTGRWYGEAFTNTKDGAEIVVEVSISSIGNGWHTCTSRDITARKITEAELQTFKDLIDSSNDAIFVVDPESAMFVGVNETACSNLQYTRLELLGKKVYDIQAIIPTYEVWRRFADNVKQKGKVIVEGEHIRKDGTRLPVEVSIKYLRRANKNYMVAIARDISKIKRFKDLKLFKNLINSSRDAFFIADANTGFFLDVNDTACMNLGYTKDELLKLSVIDIDTRFSSKDECRKDLRKLKDKGQVLFMSRLLRKDGTELQVEMSCRYVEEEGKDYVVAVARDITDRTKVETKLQKYAVDLKDITAELQSANSKLEKLVSLDPLTGLLNRRGLQQVLSYEVSKMKRLNSGFSVILMDLDDFKQINDTYGYNVGDLVLTEVGKRIKVSLRVYDSVSRIGGDEFMILLPETKLAEAMIVADKLRLAVSGSIMMMSRGTPVKVTASLGVTTVAGEDYSIDELIEKTYYVLSNSKKAGKNRVFNDKDFCDSKERMIEQLRNKESYYALIQPIFNILNRDIVAYELLSRSNVAGYEMPDNFFRVGLETRMLTLLDHNCMKVCLSAASKLPKAVMRHINVFPSTLLDVSSDKLISNIYEFDNQGKYCIEISEQQIIGDPGYIVEQINILKNAGIKIAIDDVGFGYSSLESLIILEPNVVKIDKSNVIGISTDQTKLKSLKRLAKLMASLDAEVVIAEGLQSEADLNVLKDFGIGYVQGYLLGKPAVCA